MSKNESFTVDDYRTIVAEIDDAALEFIQEQMRQRLPSEHNNMGTFLYILKRASAKIIYVSSDGNQDKLTNVLEDFCEKIQLLVKEAKVCHGGEH